MQRGNCGLTFWTSLCSAAASRTAGTMSVKPSCSRAFVIWSQAIVFFASFSEISFASDEIRVMNSTQHSIKRSRASLANATPADGGRISDTIFWTVAATKLVNGFFLIGGALWHTFRERQIVVSYKTKLLAKALEADTKSRPSVPLSYLSQYLVDAGKGIARDKL